MRLFSCLILLAVFLFSGCAHRPDAVSSLPAPSPHSGEVAASSPEQIPLNPAKASASFGSGGNGGEANGVPEGTVARADGIAPAGTPASADSAITDYGDNVDVVEEEGGGEAKAGIADPLEPFNRAMYQFNDKLYFWVLKPLAQGYKAIVPEVARVGVSNFFTNIAFPVRFVNCLLQANIGGAARELGRFALNTLGGVGGLFDPASHPDVDLAKQDEDFGQTLGVYGVGQGFYINWPILGPSSPRDTLGMAGDFFLYPITYYYSDSWVVSGALRGVEKVNDVSLRIGDYESLKEAAIDPYVAIRDAYVQYRLNKVKDKGGSPPPSKDVEKPPRP
jgi:phospholipid-binding lipoprotein MlaA